MTSVIKLLILVVPLLSSSNCVSVECEFSDDRWLFNERFYTCVAEVEDSSSELVITGKHKAGRTNADVLGLIIEKQVLPKIPAGIDEYFPNLVGLGFYDIGLKSVRADDLKQFPNLRLLIINYNILTTLEGNLLIHNPALEKVQFGYNQLQHVGNDLLINRNITEAIFWSNPCVNAGVKTREDVLHLNEILPSLCPMQETTEVPPTTTETSSDCSHECLAKFEVLESKFADAVSKYEARIQELEKKMREIGHILVDV